ncbi:MAG: glycosyltransferase [Phascolarctobacterium sp.]|nr:glycosyltransferase [Phascolarctobacterium sp.]
MEKIQKRFLTVFENFNQEHMFKDVGGIPYALSKYCHYKTTVLYLNNQDVASINGYDDYVNLVRLSLKEKNFLNTINIIWYLIKHGGEYDIVNFYHGLGKVLRISRILKIFHPRVKIYVKLDMDEERFRKVFNYQRHWASYIGYFFSQVCKSWAVDLFTVESKIYTEKLKSLKRFHGKLKYLPNGFFSDLVMECENASKEKIILTVGRIGTYQKNNELLVNAIINIGEQKLSGWKVYLVGNITDNFFKWLTEQQNQYSFLKDIIVLTGNIANKQELYSVYARASIFVLTSRWEGSPLVVPEAMHFACCPILTDCCAAIHDYVDCNSGIIVRNNDLKLVVGALENCLAEMERCIDIGENAKKRIDSTLDWNVVAHTLDNYFFSKGGLF